ncbi:uncharacterized protein LOC135212512 [Macrobrachium nipponense]|uniref:uncharacterized protein LOC135212512 n=1 Tax=Macrobrachium nipponense TaxID=159736 RepID=UPI0030C88208
MHSVEGWYTWVAAMIVLMAMSEQQSLVAATKNFTSIAITYVEGNGVVNNYLLAYGLSIPANESYYSLPTDTLCGCRTACRTSPKCSASSLQKVDGVSVCRLSVISVRNSSIAEMPNATYVFKIEKINPLFYGMGEDGLFYLVSNSNTTQSNAQSDCEAIPGHRLARPTTQLQMTTMMNIHKTAMNGADMWAKNQNNVMVMMSKGEMMVSTDTNLSILSLCQANPQHTVW